MNDSIQHISISQLDDITGGAPKWLKPAAKFAGKKILGPVGAAWTAYDGVNGFMDARKQGKGVGDSLWEGVKSAVW